MRNLHSVVKPTLILAALTLSFAGSATANDTRPSSRSDSSELKSVSDDRSSDDQRGLFLSNEEVRARGGVGNYLFRYYPGPHKKVDTERTTTASNEQLGEHQDDELVADVDSDAVGDANDQQAGIAGLSSDLKSSIMDANSKLHFDTNSSRIEDARDDLAEIGDLLSSNRSLKVEVDGFADSPGTDDYNLALSRRRADAVTDELLANGATRDQIVIKAWGESRQVPGENNRRVELNLAES